MGQCCGKPAGHSAGKRQGNAAEPSVAGQVLRSLSFIQGLKVIPSTATVAKKQDGPIAGSYVFTDSTKDYFFAAMFVDTGGVPALEHPSSGAICRDNCWPELKKAMASGEQDTEACMLAMFAALDKKIVIANRTAKSKTWAMGVVVLGEVGKRRMTVGSVGTCQASSCLVEGSFNQATSAGILLTDYTEHNRLVDAWLQQPDNPIAQAAAVGHVLGLREPAVVATPKPRAGTVGGAPESDVSHGGEGLQQSIDNPIRRMTAGPRLQAAPDAPHLKCWVTTTELWPTCRHVFLATQPLTAVMSVQDLASLAHHFTPSHIQVLREAAAGNLSQVSAHPAIRPTASPANTARSSPMAKSPRAARSSSSTPAAGKGKGPTSPRAARGQARGCNRLEALKPAATLDQNGLSIDQVVAQVVGAPRFNPAALIVHHAQAQHQIIRQRLSRWVRTHQSAAPHSSRAQPGRVLQGELPPLGEGPAPCSLVCITLEWPLSVTSQQVAIMRCVAAARAFNPGAEYRWHLVRQLMRYMAARRKRVRSAWQDTLTRVHAHLVQQRRAAEVLAWKHLGAAVVVSGGFQVASSASHVPAPPSAASTRATLSPTMTPGFGQSPRDMRHVYTPIVSKAPSSAALRDAQLRSPSPAAGALSPPAAIKVSNAHGDRPLPTSKATTLGKAGGGGGGVGGGGGGGVAGEGGAPGEQGPEVTSDAIRALVAEAARHTAAAAPPAALDVPEVDGADDGGVLALMTPAVPDDERPQHTQLLPADDGMVVVTSPNRTLPKYDWQTYKARLKTVSNSGVGADAVGGRGKEEGGGKVASRAGGYRRTGPAPDHVPAAGKSPAPVSGGTRESGYDLRKGARAAAQSYDLRSSRRTAG